MSTLKPETGYFTVSTSGARRHRFSFESAAYAIYHSDDVVRIIEIERVIVAGQLTTRERDVTESAIDFLSTYPL
jgi:hypothetical protein